MSRKTIDTLKKNRKMMGKKYLTRKEVILAVVEAWREEAKACREMFDREEARVMLAVRTDEEIKNFYEECEAYRDHHEVVIILEQPTSNLLH